MTPQPNYRSTVLPGDQTVLTDGKYASGDFWNDKDMFGWKNTKTVEILVDLEKMINIETIKLSTARNNNKGINYPAHIYIFIGNDKEHFAYIDDLAKFSENKPGPDNIKKIESALLGMQGRYVLFEIILQGSFFFSDEIEVTEGANARVVPGNMSIDASRAYAESLRKIEIEKTLLGSLLNELRPQINAYADLKNDLIKLESEITKITSLSDIENKTTELLILRGKMLQEKFPNKRVIIEEVNPWTRMSPVYMPKTMSAEGLSVILPRNGHAYSAFVITNTSDSPLTCVLTYSSPKDKSYSLDLYEIAFVKSSAMEFVADALLPLKAGIALRSGESRMIMIKLRGEESGQWSSAITMKFSNDISPLEIPLKIVVSPITLPSQLTMNTSIWPYLHFQPLNDRKGEAVKDLTSHHANVVAIPPRSVDSFVVGKPVDMSNIKSYLSNYKTADFNFLNKYSKVLVFMEFNAEQRRTCNGRCRFMDDVWKAAFINWYRALVETAKEAGILENQIYLYPYDEMNAALADEFVNFASWALNKTPQLQFYATLGKEGSFKALPYLKIAQIIDNDSVLKNIPSNTAELWLYNSQGPAKSLSPYTYYRLMAWKAFTIDFKGAGFWSYCDTKSSSAWDDFQGRGKNYAVIYEGENGTIVSSRRWEAWAIGAEDFELLFMYSKVAGSEKAKRIAKSVLNNRKEFSQADDIRRLILKELNPN